MEEEQKKNSKSLPPRKESSITADLRDSLFSLRSSWWRYGAVFAFLFCLSGWISGLRQGSSSSDIEAAVRSQLGVQNVQCVSLGESWVIFECALDESAKQRWATRWGLKLLQPEAPPVIFPSVAMLHDWQNQEDVYLAEDVDRWRQRYQLTISHGFYRQWNDGSQMLIDLQGNRLVGVVSANWASGAATD